jgi:hypothetical protein
MRNFLAEHSGAFDLNEVDTLVAAFDKAWETVQASGVVYPKAKAEAAAAMHGERDLCVPKIRFCNIGDEGRRGQAVM